MIAAVGARISEASHRQGGTFLRHCVKKRSRRRRHYM